MNVQTQQLNENKDGMNAKTTITISVELLCKLKTLAEKWTCDDQLEETGNYEHLMHLSDTDLMYEGETVGKAMVAREILTEAGIPFKITKE